MMKIKFYVMALLLMSFGASADVLLFQNDNSAIANETHYNVLEATPDGRFLYAIKSTSPASVESFEISALNNTASPTSNLTERATITTGTSASTIARVEGAQSMAFSPNADFILIGNDSAGARLGLYAFLRGAGSGFAEIQFANTSGATAVLSDGRFNEINVRDIAISADGKNIYVVGSRTTVGTGGAAVDPVGEGLIGVLGDVVFNASENRVEYKTELLVEQNDAANPAHTSLDNPISVALSSSGNNLYVLGDSSTANQDALLHFIRDGTANTLTLRSTLKNGSGTSQLTDPRDMVVTTSNNVVHIFVAATGSNSIIQFSQNNDGLTPSVANIYNSSTNIATIVVEGLDGVSKLALTSAAGILYAAASTGNRIIPLVFNDGALSLPSASAAVVNGANTSSGVAISGIENVNLLAFTNSSGNLYAASSVANTSTQIAQFSRKATLSTVATALNRNTIQPGQQAGFEVSVTNNGPTDAPGFILEISTTPSGTESIFSGTNAGSCSKTSTSVITCNVALLANSDTFRINVSIVPRAITTASIRASAISRNSVSSDSSAVDTASIKVGEFKNGSLSIGIVCHLVLLSLYLWRRRVFHRG